MKFKHIPLAVEGCKTRGRAGTAENPNLKEGEVQLVHKRCLHKDRTTSICTKEDCPTLNNNATTWKNCGYYQEMYDLRFTWNELIPCSPEGIKDPPSSCEGCQLFIGCDSDDIKSPYPNGLVCNGRGTENWRSCGAYKTVFKDRFVWSNITCEEPCDQQRFNQNIHCGGCQLLNGCSAEGLKDYES